MPDIWKTADHVVAECKLYILSDINNQSGGKFSQRLFQNHPNKSDREDSFDTLSLNRPEWAIGPYPVFGGTVLFARGPSVESWPWWTDPAAPAELREGKQGEDKRVESKSKCEISLSDGSKMSCTLVCAALHNSSVNRNWMKHMCITWRRGIAGLKWQREREREAGHQKHILQQAN